MVPRGKRELQNLIDGSTAPLADKMVTVATTAQLVAMTDKDGLAADLPVDPGRVTICVRAGDPSLVPAPNAPIDENGCWRGDLSAGQLFLVDAAFVKKTSQPPKKTVSGVVWYDSNKNGRRDSGEKKICDAMVTLWQPNGGEAIRVMTDKKGAYRFEGVLEVGKSYVLEVRYTAEGATCSGLPSTLVPTKQDAVSGNDDVDSDLGPNGTVEFTVPLGDVKLAYDAGFRRPAK